MTSVIYAMAVAQVLSGIGRLVQTDARIKWYLPHTIWSGTIFVLIFLVWWSAWEFRSAAWTFPMYLYMVVSPTLMYFACSMLIPQNVADEVDLRAHFFRIRLPFQWSFFFAATAAMLDGNLLGDEPWWFPGRIGHVGTLVCILLAILTRKHRSQLIAVVLVTLALAYVAVTRLWLPR